MKSVTIKRGELWIVDFNPGFGKEIHKKRPAVVLTSNLINSLTSFVVVVPLTSQPPYQSTPDVFSLTKVTGLDKESFALPIFIRIVDQQRLVKKIGRLTSKQMLAIEEVINVVLELNTQTE